MRTAVSAILLGLCVLSLATPAVAAEPHEVWLERLQGKWTFAWPEVGDLPGSKGEIEWKMSPGKHCLVGQRKDSDGQHVTMLLAYDGKKLTQVTFGSDRSHFRIEFTDIREDRIEGKLKGVWKGKKNTGTVVVE